MKFIVICGLLLLTACSSAPFSKSLNPHPQSQMQVQDQELFVAALEQFSTSNNLELMADLKQRYPDSIWAAYAETITQHVSELDTCRVQSDSAQVKNQQLLVELEVANQENQQLSEKIEQLKKLLIELEQRPR